jgi:chemotaxis protein CheD
MGVITVGIGDARVSSNREDLLVTHALGSCIAVAIHDSCAGVAGLLHILLPDSKSAPERALTHPCVFADTGIPALFHAAYALGAQKSRVTVRLVGGAQILDPQGVFNIGKQNYLACRRILWAAGVLISGEEVGGTISRNVRLAVGDGRLEWNSAGGPGRELAVRSRLAPAAARDPEASPAVCAQIETCREYLKEGADPRQCRNVPLGARARAPWCADCVLTEGGLRCHSAR